MSQRRVKVWAAVFALSLVVGCKKEGASPEVTQSTPAPAQQEQVADDHYTLRLMLSGLMSIVPNKEVDPTELWLLVGNATEPAKLPVQVPNMTPHYARLYVPTGSIESAAGWSSGKPCHDSSGDYQWKRLTGEHLEIGVETDSKLELASSGVPGIPTEQVADSARDFRWVVFLDQALGNLSRVNPKKQLASRLFGETYAEPSKYDLIAARLRLAAGKVYSHMLYEDPEDNSIQKFHFTNSSYTEPFAAAETVAIEIRARGPVTFQRRRLEDKTALDSYVLKAAAPGATLTVWLENEIDGCMPPPGNNEKDFYFNQNLLQDPRSIASFPEPVVDGQVQGPIPKGQCSPNHAVMPGTVR